jgi:hydrogenase maturation protease
MPAKNGTDLAVTVEKSCGTGRVLVLGLGNVLLKDEGVGVHVVEKLQELTLPCNVEVIDGGTASLNALLTAHAIEKLVVVDALRAGKEPGTIYQARLRGEDQNRLERIFGSDTKVSLHQMGLVDALAVVEKMNCAPKEIVIIGIEPDKIDWGLELTDQVKQKVPEMINLVLKEI